MIVYTCVTGGYDRIHPLPPGINGVCFTDKAQDVAGWQSLPLRWIEANPILTARKHKCLSHVLFPGQDTLWIDARYALRRLPDPVEWGAFSHKGNVLSSRQEFDAVDRHDRWSGESNRKAALDMLREYAEDGFVDDAGHPETGFLVRSDTERVRSFNELWLSKVERCTRDQISCDYCRWKVGLPWTNISGTAWSNPYARLMQHEMVLPQIYYFTPYDSDGIGVAYDKAARLVPHGAWVCLMDSDIMLFPSNFGTLVQEAVAKNPQYDIYTCLTTRVNDCGFRHLLHDHRKNEERDLIKLHDLAVEVSRTGRGKVSSIPCNLAGYFLLFRRELIDEVPFPKVGAPCIVGGKRTNGRVIGVDTAWSLALSAAGKKAGILEGLLAVHYYRMGTNKRDHLIELEWKDTEGDPPVRPEAPRRRKFVVDQNAKRPKERKRLTRSVDNGIILAVPQEGLADALMTNPGG